MTHAAQDARFRDRRCLSASNQHHARHARQTASASASWLEGEGVEVSRVDVDPTTGKISVIFGKAGKHSADNEVENWLSKQKE